MVHGKETETGSYITLEWICNVADGWLAQARIFRLIKTLSAAGGLIRTLDITSASSATGGTAVQRGSLFHVIELRACPKTFSVVQNPASGFQSPRLGRSEDSHRNTCVTRDTYSHPPPPLWRPTNQTSWHSCRCQRQPLTWLALVEGMLYSSRCSNFALTPISKCFWFHNPLRYRSRPRRSLC